MSQTRAAGISNQHRMAEIGFRDARGQGAIVFDATCLRQADWSVFDAATYASAVPVDGEGGRGSAWFVQADCGPAVLKRYLRGGWLAMFNRDAYLWLGRGRVRSLREFELLRDMQHVGLPVPAPIAAGWRRNGALYRAGLITQRLAGVESFVAAVRRRGAEAPWAAVGATVARFHQRGLRHADLNAHNLLLARDDTVHVIDWDKATTEAAPGAWCRRVLARLERSLRKQLPDLDRAVLATGMARLREAHARGLAA